MLPYVILIMLCIGYIIGCTTIYNILHLKVLTTNKTWVKVLSVMGIVFVCITGCLCLGLLLFTISHVCILLA